MQWWSKYLGRVLGVPSLFTNFLGTFLYMEDGVSRSCVHFPGARSNSPAADPGVRSGVRLTGSGPMDS